MVGSAAAPHFSPGSETYMLPTSHNARGSLVPLTPPAADILSLPDVCQFHRGTMRSISREMEGSGAYRWGAPAHTSTQGYTCPHGSGDTPLGTYLVQICKGLGTPAHVNMVTPAHMITCAPGIRKEIHVCACTRPHRGHEHTWDTHTGVQGHRCGQSKQRSVNNWREPAVHRP